MRCGRKGATPHADDRQILIVGRLIALLYAAAMIIFLAVSTIGTLVKDTVTVSLPVEQFWPEPYPWVTLHPAPAASVVSGGFTTADVMVSGLSMDARWLFAAGGAVQSLTLIMIALVFALLCHRLLTGTPFRPLLARSTTWAAVVVAVGGMAWQILFTIGGVMASQQVLPLSGWESTAPSADLLNNVESRTGLHETGIPMETVAMTLEFWPLLLGLVLAAVAVAFRYSERLQKETEGLV